MLPAENGLGEGVDDVTMTTLGPGRPLPLATNSFKRRLGDGEGEADETSLGGALSDAPDPGKLCLSKVFLKTDAGFILLLSTFSLISAGGSSESTDRLSNAFLWAGSDDRGRPPTKAAATDRMGSVVAVDNDRPTGAAEALLMPILLSRGKCEAENANVQKVM